MLALRRRQLACGVVMVTLCLFGCALTDRHTSLLQELRTGQLLDIDSSIGARKELATELDCPTNLLGDSAKMNMWLHKTVLARIAANGGNVPKELLD